MKTGERLDEAEGSSLRASRRRGPCPHLDFGLLAAELGENISLVSAPLPSVWSLVSPAPAERATWFEVKAVGENGLNPRRVGPSFLCPEDKAEAPREEGEERDGTTRQEEGERGGADSSSLKYKGLPAPHLGRVQSSPCPAPSGSPQAPPNPSSRGRSPSLDQAENWPRLCRCQPVPWGGVARQRGNTAAPRLRSPPSVPAAASRSHSPVPLSGSWKPLESATEGPSASRATSPTHSPRNVDREQTMLGDGGGSDPRWSWGRRSSL